MSKTALPDPLSRRVLGQAFRSIAAIVALAACGSGDILDEQQPANTPDGPAIAGAPARGPAAAMAADPTQVDGAKSPGSVFRAGVPFKCDTSLSGQVGVTPLRRLTQSEYDNTIRDAFGGMELTPPAHDGLPDDRAAGPFTSNAVGSLVADVIDKFAASSQRVADAVVGRVDQLMPCGASGDANCARMFIEKYGPRVFRRPITADQTNKLLQVYMAGAQGASFKEGINYTVQAMLMSPYFLYHLETKPKTPGVQPLDPYELAERMSYYIWGTIPDDALMQVAASGKLSDMGELKSQATRMFADPKAAARLDEFTEQWLSLQWLKAGQFDLPKPLYDTFTPEYAQAALVEAKKFVAWVLRGSGDGRLETLLTSNMSFPSGPLFDGYKMTQPAGYDGSKPITIPGRRAGVLTLPATMTGHASEATSPIKRGVFVMNGIICNEITFPVGLDIPALGPPPPGTSIRQQLSDVTKKAQCMPCHGKINPIGFAFEGYDRMGRERSKDDFGADVDQKGVVAVGDPSLDGPIDGAPALAQRIMQSDSGRACMMQQLFRFALGRLEDRADTCGFSALAEQFAGSNFDVRALMTSIVLQNSFRFQKGS